MTSPMCFSWYPEMGLSLGVVIPLPLPSPDHVGFDSPHEHSLPQCLSHLVNSPENLNLQFPQIFCSVLHGHSRVERELRPQWKTAWWQQVWIVQDPFDSHALYGPLSLPLPLLVQCQSFLVEPDMEASASHYIHLVHSGHSANCDLHSSAL